MKLFKDILTGVNNENYDLVHVAVFVSLVFYLLFSGWHLYDDNVFTPMEFVQGITLLIVGSGIGSALKTTADSNATKGT